MKITKVEIRKLNLPLVHSFKWSLGELTRRKETVITKLYTDEGVVGYGESPSLLSPIYNHETSHTIMYIQSKFIAPRIVDRHFETPDDFRTAYDEVMGNSAAKTGPECAFWHLLSQRENKSLKALFGGVQNEIPVGESIGIKPSIQGTLDEIARRLDEGYVRIKLKVRPGWDTALLEAVRKNWPDIDLNVDGNSSYRFSDHAQLLKSFDAFNLTMLEQPLAANNLVDHAALQKQISTPICLDESIQSIEHLRSADALGACKIVNIKPVRVGGIIESLKIHDFAAAHDIGVWCGGMFETGIGRAFNIALAAKENFIYAADMSPYWLYYAEDLVEPSFTVKKNGHIDVPDIPGLGYQICDDRIEQYTVEKIVI